MRNLVWPIRNNRVSVVVLYTSIVIVSNIVGYLQMLLRMQKQPQLSVLMFRY